MILKDFVLSNLTTRLWVHTDLDALRKAVDSVKNKILCGQVQDIPKEEEKYKEEPYLNNATHLIRNVRLTESAIIGDIEFIRNISFLYSLTKEEKLIPSGRFAGIASENFLRETTFERIDEIFGWDLIIPSQHYSNRYGGAIPANVPDLNNVSIFFNF